jgi:diaminohydroxyphosphoribosylaminopyrimidine deaminase / 5-amino-6-(5-phosphoribosylamino)uracil reductase
VKLSLEDLMAIAIAEGEKARLHAPPNPWVGAIIVNTDDVIVGQGHTQAPGDAHAEIEALRQAGESARGATMVVTLEPCNHHGRTGPCVEAIIQAGVTRVVIGIGDPDARVAGTGVEALRRAGIDVVTDVLHEEVQDQLAPYLWHRRTGRPYVVAKVAATLDGRVAMGDRSSQWITDEEARLDAHLLRAQSQAIVVGAETVRRDDPSLTARLGDVVIEPLRVVLGTAPESARIRPCLEMKGEPDWVLENLAAHDVLQVLIEGGPTTLGRFLEAGLVNRLVWYIAPAWAGASHTLGALEHLTTPSMKNLRRGHLVSVRTIGENIRIDVEV